MVTRKGAMQKKLLVVEDDVELTKVLDLNLRQAGFEVECVGDGVSALEKIRGGTFDAVILDLLIPGVPGIDVCRTARQEQHTIPIVILTANDEEVYRVLGLELGADDYIAKPFSLPELVARLRALFSRIEMI